MCKKTDLKQTPLIMLDLKSYETSDGQAPRKRSSFVTGIVFIIFLILSEMTFKYLFYSMKDLHPIFENQTNRFILARHIGVDSLSCLIVAWLGWSSRHISIDMVTAAVGGKSSAMAPGGYEQRLFTYHPASFRIALFFFVFQLKNLFDTIMWNDGPEYVFHHVLSLLVSWGAMYPGCAHFYGVFFLGLSEISTAVLCVLANFDDEHGVVGLGEAFPKAKMAVGVAFVCLFIICRTIMWPVASYYFVRDSMCALKAKSARTEARKGWIKLFVVCLSGLSVLQVAWLFQIFIIAKREIETMSLM